MTATGITVNTMISASIPDILNGLGAAPGLAGVLIGAATLPGIALAPVVGVLADRHGRREVLVPCLVVFAVAGGLGALASSFWILAGLRFLQGAGSAGLINLAIVLIGDHWDDTRRAAMIGRNSAVLTACLAVFPAVGGALTDLGGWRAPFLVYPLGLVTALFVARRLGPGGGADVTVREQIAELLPVLGRRSVLAVMAATTVVFALIFGAILTVLPLYAEAQFGLGATWRGVLLGLPAIGSTAAALLLGRLVRRFGRRRLLTGGVVLGTVGLVAIGVSPSVLLLAVAAVVYGLFEGITIPTLQDMTTAAGGDRSRGGTVAVQVSAARLGQTVGPLGLGAAFGAVGATPTYLLAAVALPVALIPLIRIATSEPLPPGPSEPSLPWE